MTQLRMSTLTTLVLRDYVYLVCISIPCRLLVTMDESSVVTDDCRIDLSGLQPAIKSISVIIPAAMRKGMILPHIW